MTPRPANLPALAIGASLFLVACDPSADAGRGEADDGALRARVARIRAIQTGADRAYYVSALRDRSLAYGAEHPKTGMRMLFDADGVRIRSARGQQPLGLVLRSLQRRGGQLPLPGAPPRAQRNRVTYERGPLTEWFLSGPLGLEHGMIIEERPMDGPAPLEVEVEVWGAVASEIGDGSAIALRGNNGRVYHYRDAFTLDADERILPTRLRVRDGRILIQVDDAHARYPIEIDPIVTEDQALTGSDTAGVDAFGYATAFQGDLVVVSAPQNDAVATDAGAVYVFRWDGSEFVEEAILHASDGEADNWFGFSVDLYGTTIVVGAPRAAPGTGTDCGRFFSPCPSGKAYFYEYEGGSWVEDGIVTGGYGERLGTGVTIDGDTAVLGAGSLYADDGLALVYTRTTGGWTHQQTLTEGARGDYGYSVAVQGDRAVIGAPGDSLTPSSAYVYLRTGSTFELEQRLSASDPSYSTFGGSVAIDDATIVIGDSTHTHGAIEKAGAVYVFGHSSGTWMQTQEIVGGGYDYFGVDVDIEGNYMVIGCLGRASSGCQPEGAAYVYKRSSATSSFSRVLTLNQERRTFAEELGISVSISGDRVLAGDFKADVTGGDSGGAYLFTVVASQPNGASCTRNGECVSGLCVDEVCCNNACGGSDPLDCVACSVAAGAATNGTCGPLSATVAPTIECRPAAGECDSPETCEEGNTVCPTDLMLPATTQCREPANACDDPEFCDGESPLCPLTMVTGCSRDGGARDGGLDSGVVTPPILPPPPADSGCGCVVAAGSRALPLWLCGAFLLAGLVFKRR
jgi:hypothetical protein